MKSAKFFITVITLLALSFGFFSCTTEESEKFNITIATDIENGTVKANRSSAAADKTVRLTVTPKSGYELDTISVKSETGGSVELTVVTEGKTYTFIMPESDVIVTATFKEKTSEPTTPITPTTPTTPTEPSQSDAKTYTVEISETEHGTVTASKSSEIEAGESITLTITPDEDYELDTLFVKDADGNKITVEDNSFTMPESDVIVTATFKIIDTTPAVETKAKPDAVGDIVLSDGTAVAKENASSMSASQKAKAIAVIFYIGTECSNDSRQRMLGVGLSHGKAAWCTTDANAYGKNIESIVCSGSLAGGVLSSVSGDKDGSDNITQIGEWLSSNASTDDTESEAKYPAFYFAKNYKDVENSHVAGTDFEDGWYLPTLQEFYQIYLNKDVVNAASKVCDGSQFDVDSYYWVSSMASSAGKPFYTGTLTKASLNGFVIPLPPQFFMNTNENSESKLIVCAIREFN